MQIHGIDNMTMQQLQQEIAMGGKFVVFEYCVSIIIMTFKRPSGVYFIRAGQSTMTSSIMFTLITLVFGWWGIPWGPIYSVMSLVTNFGGGKDVTYDVVNSLRSASVNPQMQ